MRKQIQLNPSGISFVDEAWGGFYDTGTYLLAGPHKSGRTLLGLQYTRQAINQQKVCIYFTNMRPKDLMINAASINFDLQDCMEQNQVILIRINLPDEKELKDDPDNHLSAFLKDIVSVLEQYQPGKIVFDELTPFVNFNDIDKLKETYIQVCEAIENMGVTSFFILSEPVSEQSRKIMELLKENSTGFIQLKKKQSPEGLFYGGIITIIPNIGHTEGQFKADYHIQPQKGIITDFIPTKKPVEEIKTSDRDRETPYKLLSEIETAGENIPAIDFYNEKEFRLLLSNQIAIYKSTGQMFYLCSLLLDETAEEKSLLTKNQLKNAVRLSIDKKDKIAVIKNKIIVLVIDDDQKIINKLLARIKCNLLADNSDKLSRIVQYISVYTVQIDATINNADEMLKKVLTDGTQNKFA